jgi:hypothetical protein
VRRTVYFPARSALARRVHEPDPDFSVIRHTTTGLWPAAVAVMVTLPVAVTAYLECTWTVKCSVFSWPDFAVDADSVSAVDVLTADTVRAAVVEADELKLVSPLYEPLTEYLPAGSLPLGILHDPVPADKVIVHRVVPDSWTATVPVGVPADDETVAVNDSAPSLP